MVAARPRPGTAVEPSAETQSRNRLAGRSKRPRRRAQGRLSILANAMAVVCPLTRPPTRRVRGVAAPRAHDRRDLGAEQLDRAHDARVRQRADAELHEEAVVAEELVLEEDLLDDLLRAADEVRAAQRRGWPRTARASSAASRARGRCWSIIALERREGARPRRACEVSAMKPCELMLNGRRSWPACGRGLAVQLDERREALGLAADDGQRHAAGRGRRRGRPTAACRRRRPRRAAGPARGAGRRPGRRSARGGGPTR